MLIACPIAKERPPDLIVDQRMGVLRIVASKDRVVRINLTAEIPTAQVMATAHNSTRANGARAKLTSERPRTE